MPENKTHIKSAFALSLLVNTECRTTHSVPSSIWLFTQLKKIPPKTSSSFVLMFVSFCKQNVGLFETQLMQRFPHITVLSTMLNMMSYWYYLVGDENI